MQDFLLKIISRWIGKEKGQDQFGNIYFEHNSTMQGKYMKRWVIYYDSANASKIPPEFHAWLHYCADSLPLYEDSNNESDTRLEKNHWHKEHRENLTGTAHAYRPQGHIYKGGVRAKASGDYEAWSTQQ